MEKSTKKQYALIHIDRFIIGGEEPPPTGGSVWWWFIVIGLWQYYLG